MEQLWRFANRPFALLGRYIGMHPLSHAVVVSAVLAAVGCSVGAQYGVKFLVDTLSHGPNSDAWLAFALLATLIAADNLLWRLASWIAGSTFVTVTGDVRRDLFRHLTGHAASYFADRLPGTLTARITAVSNATYTIENMFIWNVLPPCVATAGAVIFVATVSVPMALGLAAVAGVAVAAMFRLAAAGGPLHNEFADRAAAVDGEMVDVVSNMPLVKAFCGLGRELRRFDEKLAGEMTARRRSLRHLEKVRLLHAVITVVLTVALLAWAIVLWQRGQASTGEVVLVSTLGLSVLHATRDLAVALVDVTQHVARLSEALSILLV
ncbi:MAG TPA: ABC transporter ATP-binding protein, partial [Xanthobacteraceae bacterium]|nr:ABC transporter ATP-binding protein [Xanthobacteraceae bacterium]